MSEITDTSYQESIAAAVRAEFARRGINRSELGKVIGRSRPTAAGRWHGTSPYTSDELDQVSTFLGITPYDLNESAALGSRHSDRSPSVDATIPSAVVDPWAQPARSRSRRA